MENQQISIRKKGLNFSKDRLKKLLFVDLYIYILKNLLVVSKTKIVDLPCNV